MPATRGIKPAVLLGIAPARNASNRTRATASASSAHASVPPPMLTPDVPTVEIIRGDKRSHEVVRQEHE